MLVAFGGLGTLLGPVVGAGVFGILDEQLSTSLELREVLYGVLVIAIFLGFRRALVHAVTALGSRVVARLRRKPAVEPRPSRRMSRRASSHAAARADARPRCVARGVPGVRGSRAARRSRQRCAA